MRIRVPFPGFWCRRCEGRVFEDEVYYELDATSRKKVKMVQLTCTLCSRQYKCQYKDYVRLLENIEQIILRKRRAKNNKESLLSG